MRRLSVRLAAAAALVTLVTATTGGCGDGAPTPEAACVDLQSVQCERLAACWPTEMIYAWGDVATCKAAQPAACKAAAALPGVTFDASAEESCASAYKRATCDEAFNYYGVLPGCENVSKGALKSGASCAASAQCASQACVEVGAGPCGVCGTAAQLGDGCARQTKVCGAGAYCDPMSKCKTLPTKGESCDAAELCGGTSYCEKGKCGDPLEAGAPCDPDNDACEFLEDLSCGTNDTCVKSHYAFAHLNQRCGFKGQSFTFCDGTTFCSAVGTGEGKCEARIAVGKPCKTLPDGTDHCAPGAACRKDTCSTDYPSCK